MKDKTENDKKWETIFEDKKILQKLQSGKPFITISAKEIKSYGREPRLMTKFDHSINLPKIFAQNHLSILPISRREYVLSSFETFHSFEEDEQNQAIANFSLPTNLQSITNDMIFTSEAIALNAAFASTILHDFLNVSEFLMPTISGRMRSGLFKFNINSNVGKIQLNISNSQIEIDAAYESLDSLALIEAKRNIADDFIIRQLYYPYRLWSNRITKRVRPIFLTYSNGIFILREYTFNDMNNYNSISLVRQKKYSLEDTGISAADIQDLLCRVRTIPEPDVPFPQANSFDRVINLCELIRDQTLNKENITEEYAFDPRQTDYYTNAAIYLGLISKKTEEKHACFVLSEKGKSILSKKFKERQLAFCKLILSHKPFKDALEFYFDKGIVPPPIEMVAIMRQTSLYNVESVVTCKRRASTVQAWIKWIVGLINS